MNSLRKTFVLRKCSPILCIIIQRKTCSHRCVPMSCSSLVSTHTWHTQTQRHKRLPLKMHQNEFRLSVRVSVPYGADKTSQIKLHCINVPSLTFINSHSLQRFLDINRKDTWHWVLHTILSWVFPPTLFVLCILLITFISPLLRLNHFGTNLPLIHISFFFFLRYCFLDSEQWRGGRYRGRYTTPGPPAPYMFACSPTEPPFNLCLWIPSKFNPVCLFWPETKWESHLPTKRKQPSKGTIRCNRTFWYFQCLSSKLHSVTRPISQQNMPLYWLLPTSGFACADNAVDCNQSAASWSFYQKFNHLQTCYMSPLILWPHLNTDRLMVNEYDTLGNSTVSLYVCYICKQDSFFSSFKSSL